MCGKSPRCPTNRSISPGPRHGVPDDQEDGDGDPDPGGGAGGRGGYGEGVGVDLGGWIADLFDE